MARTRRAMSAAGLVALVLAACGKNEPAIVPDGGAAAMGTNQDGSHGAGDAAPLEAAAPEAGTAGPNPELCHIFCLAADLAQCLAAPSHSECLAWCEGVIRACPDAARSLLDCQFANVELGCDSSGRVTSRRCSAELEAARACVDAGGP